MVTIKLLTAVNINSLQWIHWTPRIHFNIKQFTSQTFSQSDPNLDTLHSWAFICTRRDHNSHVCVDFWSGLLLPSGPSPPVFTVWQSTAYWALSGQIGLCGPLTVVVWLECIRWCNRASQQAPKVHSVTALARLATASGEGNFTHNRSIFPHLLTSSIPEQIFWYVLAWEVALAVLSPYWRLAELELVQEPVPHIVCPPSGPANGRAGAGAALPGGGPWQLGRTGTVSVH